MKQELKHGKLEFIKRVSSHIVYGIGRTTTATTIEVEAAEEVHFQGALFCVRLVVVVVVVVVVIVPCFSLLFGLTY